MRNILCRRRRFAELSGRKHAAFSTIKVICFFKNTLGPFGSRVYTGSCTFSKMTKVPLKATKGYPSLTAAVVLKPGYLIDRIEMMLLSIAANLIKTQKI